MSRDARLTLVTRRVAAISESQVRFTMHLDPIEFHGLQLQCLLQWDAQILISQFDTTTSLQPLCYAALHLERRAQLPFVHAQLGTGLLFLFKAIAHPPFASTRLTV